MTAAFSQEMSAAGSPVFQQPVFGKGAVLDFRQGFLHGGAGLVGHDLLAGMIIAVFRSIADGMTHLRHAAFIAEVNDQFHFMEAFEVRDFRLIACFNQRVEAGFHQCADAAAQYALLAEQVGLGFFLEGGLDNACAGAADAAGIRQGHVKAFAGSILIHRKYIGNAGAFRKYAANQMAGALRGNHEYVYVCCRDDLFEMNIEAMGKSQGAAGFQVRRNLALVNVSLFFVRDQDHGDVSPFNRFADGHNLQARCFRFCRGFGTFVQANHYFQAAVTQVQRMGVALAAVTDDRNFFTLNRIPVYILIIIHFCHDKSLLF